MHGEIRIAHTQRILAVLGGDEFIVGGADGRDEFRDVVKRFGDDVVLLVTHEMQFAREVSNRVLMFDHGQIIEETDPVTMFPKPEA